MQYLSHAIQSSNCNIDDLKLDNNNIGDAGLEHLSHALKHSNCSISTLNLENTGNITAEGAEFIYAALLSRKHSQINITDFKGFTSSITLKDATSVPADSKNASNYIITERLHGRQIREIGNDIRAGIDASLPSPTIKLSKN